VIAFKAELAGKLGERSPERAAAKVSDIERVARQALTVSDVAGRMLLSEGTVRNHVSNAIQKLNARNRTEAASRVLKKVGEGFGDQVAQILGDSENRSKAYWRYASRGSQESTTEMGRLGAEAPSIPFSTAC